MKILPDHPAIIFHLNPLSSLLGKYYSRHKPSIKTLNIEVEKWVNIIGKEIVNGKPLLPKNDSYSMQQLKKVVGKVQKQLSSPKIPSSLKADIRSTINVLRLISDKKQPDNKLQVDPDILAKSLGIPDLWDRGKQYAKEELLQFQSFNKHPRLNRYFCQRISPTEIKKWIQTIKNEVLQSSITLYPLKIYKEKSFEKRHLMWTITNSGLEYSIPDFLTKAQFWSWDCPHNIAHLLHLSSLPIKGILTYRDTMYERSYFESVAVFAEYKMWEYLISSKPLPVTLQQRQWIVKDRGHEFLLRLIRLLADQLFIEGARYPEIVTKLHQTTGIPLQEVKNEVSRYYGFLGLGSIYTVGYINHKVMNRTFDEAVRYVNDKIYTE